MAEAALRLWAKIDKRGPDECWPWQAAMNKYGYGMFWFEGMMQHAHHVVYVLVVGRVPEDKDVCHDCNHSWCCNPAHLFLATHLVNMQDRNAVGNFGHSCLTWEKVRKIRELRNEGESMNNLAAAFNVSHSAIRNILDNTTWKEG